VPCTAANTGDTAPYPRQDGRFGRDAAATSGVLTKSGGGAAGFDFTPLAADGTEIPLTGNPPVPSATPACIRDNHTNLTWEVKTDDGGLRDKDWTYTWYDSTAADPGTPDWKHNGFDSARCDTEKFIADVNSVGLCGHTSAWRLPTTQELLSIVNNGVFNPSVDTNYFPNTIGWLYWSADTYVHSPQHAWGVDFGDGYATSHSKANDDHVLLVHGDQTSPSFSDNGDGTVTDNNTGLVWDRCSWGQDDVDCSGGSAAYHDWQAALGVAGTANTANYKGHNDWRLPNKNELASLVDRSRLSPAIDGAVFPTTSPWLYWSSTRKLGQVFIWFIDFDRGVASALPEHNGLHVRLVRSGHSFDPWDLLGCPVANPVAGGAVSCVPNPVDHGSNSICTATPNQGYTFANWSGDCMGSICELTNVTVPKSVRADFIVSSGGGGDGVPALSAWGLGLLAGLLAVLGGVRKRRPECS
jgi:hypothetical protein